jgi:hypothetical protein
LPIAARQVGLDILVHEVDNHLSEYHEWPRGPRRDPAGGAPLAPGPEERIAELEGQVAHLHEVIASLEQQVHAAHARGAADLEILRTEFESTTSWRLTRPVRALKSAIDRRRGRDQA